MPAQNRIEQIEAEGTITSFALVGPRPGTDSHELADDENPWFICTLKQKMEPGGVVTGPPSGVTGSLPSVPVATPVTAKKVNQVEFALFRTARVVADQIPMAAVQQAIVATIKDAYAKGWSVRIKGTRVGDPISGGSPKAPWPWWEINRIEVVPG